MTVGEGEEGPLGDVDDRRRLDGDGGRRVGAPLPRGDDSERLPRSDDPEDHAPRRGRLDDLHGPEGHERHLGRPAPLVEDRVSPIADLKAAHLREGPRFGRVQAAEQSDSFEQGERHDFQLMRIPAWMPRKPALRGRTGNIPAS